MRLDTTILDILQRKPDGTIIAACPACRAAGGDQKGEHLIVYPDGRFGCAAHQGDAEHRRAIFQLNTRGHVAPPARKTSTNLSPKPDNTRLTERVWHDLETFLQPYHEFGTWRLELTESSPVAYKAPESWNPHSMLQGLYGPTDLLWMGNVYDTGLPHHTANFKTRDEWLQHEKLPPRLAAGTFKIGSTSRSQNSVLTAPYIVLESDTLIGHKPETLEEKALNQCLSYGLIRYAQEALGLNLRAVVDTQGKSLHAWFDKPSPEQVEAILAMADGLRIDKEVMNQAQILPLRAPGCRHEKSGGYASLLYLNPKY